MNNLFLTRLPDVRNNKKSKMGGKKVSCKLRKALMP